MAKKKAEKPKRELTKYQLSRWQQHKKRQRLILIAGISIIAAVGGIIGGGWYVNEYRPLQETVIRVNDVEFSMKYYIDMLELNYRYSLTGDVVTFIERNELIRQGAEDLGITVSDSEVAQALESYNPPLTEKYRDVAMVDVLIDKLRNEYFEQRVPRYAEQRHIMAMFLESEDQATEVRDRLENGESFGDLAGELSLDSLTKVNNGDLSWHPRGILSELLASPIPEDYAFTSEAGALSQPLQDEAKTKGVGYWVVEVLEIDEEKEQVRPRAILLGSEQEAREVIARLENGADFKELAKELSQDQVSGKKGGTLGWLSPGEANLPIEEFIFSAEPEKLSQPIRDDGVLTQGGYWLVEVLAVDEDRKIEDSDRELLKQKALSEWVSSLWDNPQSEVEDYLDSAKIAWARARALRNISK